MPPLVRAALQRDYRQHVERYVLPTLTNDGRTFGTLCIADLKPAHLLQLRERLLKRGLALKTVRNIMDASLRAMIRDARTIDLLIAADPFAALTWPRLPQPKPDPFTVAERDRIVGWFLEHRRSYFPFVFTLFHTGMRPSEAVALRWNDVDTSAGRITISRSRYLGHEAAPKTAGSRRTIRLLPDLRVVLHNLKPLHIDADDYVFTNAKNGAPIEQSEWPKSHWRPVLRALEIRPRKFYATRHTFISVALTAGVNLKRLAEYCGTSVAMIESHYGRYLERDGERELQLLIGSETELSSYAGLGERLSINSAAAGAKSSPDRSLATQGIGVEAGRPDSCVRNSQFAPTHIRRAFSTQAPPCVVSDMCATVSMTLEG